MCSELLSLSWQLNQDFGTSNIEIYVKIHLIKYFPLKIKQ